MFGRWEYSRLTLSHAPECSPQHCSPPCATGSPLGSRAPRRESHRQKGRQFHSPPEDLSTLWMGWKGYFPGRWRSGPSTHADGDLARSGRVSAPGVKNVNLLGLWALRAVFNRLNPGDSRSTDFSESQVLHLPLDRLQLHLGQFKIMTCG